MAPAVSNRCNSDQADVELCAGTENRRIGELNLPLRLLSKKSHNHPQPYRMAEKWDYQTEKIKNFELRALRKNCLQSKSSVCFFYKAPRGLPHKDGLHHDSAGSSDRQRGISQAVISFSWISIAVTMDFSDSWDNNNSFCRRLLPSRSFVRMSCMAVRHGRKPAEREYFGIPCPCPRGILLVSFGSSQYPIE